MNYKHLGNVRTTHKKFPLDTLSETHLPSLFVWQGNSALDVVKHRQQSLILPCLVIEVQERFKPDLYCQS